MMGKNHIVCTTSMVSTLGVIHLSLLNIQRGHIDNFYGFDLDKLIIIQKIDSEIWSFLGFNYEFGTPFSAKLLITIISFFLVVLLGTLFTDCDSNKSIIGKIIYIPVGHKTWLHALWVPLILTVASSSFVPFVWFSLGWLLHEFMDSFSYCGNSYLYPIVGYRKYGDAKVKKGIHNFKMYRTGQKSESVFVFIVVFLCIIISASFLASPYFHIDIIGKGVGLWS